MKKEVVQCTGKLAFSLVEMLMALLVASLLMISLAPVMTKRFNENVRVSSINDGVYIPKVFCAYVNNGNSVIKKEDEVGGCIVPDKTYNGNAIIVSGGGGGGGAALSTTGTVEKTLISGNNTGSGSLDKSATFDKFTKNLTIKISSGGGGAGGGNWEGENLMNATPSEENCKKYAIGKSDTTGHTSSYTNPITIYDDKYKLCVTKYSQKNTSGCVQYTNSSNGKSAWLCGTYASATEACTNLQNTLGDGTTWTIATYTHQTNWTSTFRGSFGPCMFNSSDCPYVSNCNGGSADCYPYHPWTDSLYSNSNCKGYSVSVYPSGYFCTISRSSGVLTFGTVLCEASKVNVSEFKPRIGGGGSSGILLNISLTDSIIENATKEGDAKVKVSIGDGGAGGSSVNTATAGTGGSSVVEIYDKNNSLVWKLTVPGGLGGVGASKTAGGAAGSATTAKCKYLDKKDANFLTEKEVECNAIPTLTSIVASTAGVAGTSTGYGGISKWTTATGDRTSPGAGGNGGTCTDNPSDSTHPNCTAGSDGIGGAVKITYKTSYPGIGGGGGGAGALVHLKNFSVRPNDLIKIQVGHGGAGGAIGSDGSDGGTSYIEITRNDAVVTKYEVLGGGGGKKGTAGNPDSNPVVLPVFGAGGAASSIPDATKKKITPADNFYPTDLATTKGSDADNSDGWATATGIITKSAGGDGGINNKISGLASTDASTNGLPCAGASTKDISFDATTTKACTNALPTPLPLSRTLFDYTFMASNLPDYIKDYAPGATGGGGGGWVLGGDPSESGAGAKGMGGYVIIYFGDWSGEEAAGP